MVVSQSIYEHYFFLCSEKLSLVASVRVATLHHNTLFGLIPCILYLVPAEVVVDDLFKLERISFYYSSLTDSLSIEYSILLLVYTTRLMISPFGFS
jgi:hypothetical protein